MPPPEAGSPSTSPPQSLIDVGALVRDIYGLSETPSLRASFRPEFTGIVIAWLKDRQTAGSLSALVLRARNANVRASEVPGLLAHGIDCLTAQNSRQKMGLLLKI